MSLVKPDKFECKRPLNPMPIFNLSWISSDVAVILLFGRFCMRRQPFSAHHLNRHMLDPVFIQLC